MKNDHIRHLMEHYIAGKLNDEESADLGRLLQGVPDEDLYQYIKAVWADFVPERVFPDEKSDELIGHILSRQPQKKHFSLRPFWKTISVAAMLAVVFGTGLFFLLNKKAEAYSVVLKSEPVKTSQVVAYTRNVTLPDGSTVVLKAGSTLDFPAKFVGKKREVTLSGEAYFDVVHNEKQTFVIRTGAITTTVLGTAFNIKAWPEDKNVVVSVTRGRVKVENQNKVLAVLTPDKEFDYKGYKESGQSSHKVNAAKVVTEWTSDDVNFNGETLETIAGVLSKRFGVNINIADRKLADAQFVLSFSGTESLSSILDIICTVNESGYEMNGSEIYISEK